MTSLAATRAALVAAVASAGIRVTDDPRNVNPPCVLVGLVDGQRKTGCVFIGTCDVEVIAPGAGHADAAGWLDATAPVVAHAVGATNHSKSTYPLGDANLLAYTLTVPVAWEVP